MALEKILAGIQKILAGIFRILAKIFGERIGIDVQRDRNCRAIPISFRLQNYGVSAMVVMEKWRKKHGEYDERGEMEGF